MPFLKPKTMKAVFLLFLVLCGGHSYAWGPLAHYLITQKRILGHNAMPVSVSYGGQISTDTLQYVNLPDAWPSNTEPDYGLTVGITPYFCWSHGVRSTGVVDLAWNPVEIPKKPLYHPDFPACEPGRVMAALLDGKADLASRWPEHEAAIRAHLEMAAHGFRFHNEEDTLVHWAYFLGADGSEQSNGDAQAKWTIHHGLKEHWAEYVLLATQTVGKYELERDDFDESGHIVFPSGIEAPRLAIEGLNSNNYDNDKINTLAWLLRLAQLAYNKNRTSRSVDHPEQYGLTVQSVEDIKKLLKKQDAELRNFFSQKHWAKWEINENVLPVNFQSGNLTVTLLNGTTETMDYDTPDNLWIEWQMLKQLAKVNYRTEWIRSMLFTKSGLVDIPIP